MEPLLLLRHTFFQHNLNRKVNRNAVLILIFCIYAINHKHNATRSCSKHTPVAQFFPGGGVCLQAVHGPGPLPVDDPVPRLPPGRRGV